MKTKNDPFSLVEQIKRLAANPKSRLKFSQIRVIVAIERVIARLEAAPRLRDHLLFKGGFVLLKTIESARFTRDLDALAFDIDQKKAMELIKNALEHNIHDELWFVDTRVEPVPNQGEYGGLRANCGFHIGKEPPEKATFEKLSRLHIDIGIGDEVPAHAKRSIARMPTVLGSAPLSWRVYPLEFIFAEKLQTLLARGSANSRAKDVYDLVEIFPRCKSSADIARAVRVVCQKRNTRLPENLVEVVGRIDRGVLTAAWGSVDVAGKAPAFKDCWDQLMALLTKLAKELVE